MKTPGYVLAVIGIILAAIGLINHFGKLGLPVISSITHGDVIVAAVGAVVFIIGAVLAMSGGSSAA